VGTIEMDAKGYILTGRLAQLGPSAQRVEARARAFFLGDEHAGSVRCRRRALPLRQARRICSGRGRHCDPACPRVLARSMIAAKYRLFSPEPKTSKFPRYAHTEEVAIPSISIFGRHAISPGWSLALIGNASAQKFPGRPSGPEAFSMRRQVGSRWRLRRTRLAMGFE
jgi:hypothetical protein